MNSPLNNKNKSISEDNELAASQTAIESLLMNGGAESGTMYGLSYLLFGIANKSDSRAYSFGTSVLAPTTSIMCKNLCIFWYW